MDRICAAAGTFRVCMVGIAGWLYGCSHRRTTFPMTLPSSAAVEGQPDAEMETYVVCLECGRRFPYDWTAMRAGKRPAAGPGGRRRPGGKPDPDAVSRSAVETT